MAIIVTNPSTVQFSGAPTEPQDPAVMPLDVGFTEELANAMQPNALASEDALKVQNLLKQQAENPQADLQILPPDVLLNAVGEANFAYVAQTNAAPEVPLLVDGELEVAQASDVLSEQQAAELAAASLAAQMAGLDQVRTDQLAMAFIGVRIVYTGLYLANIAALRTVVWSVGLGLTVAIFSPTISLLF